MSYIEGFNRVIITRGPDQNMRGEIVARMSHNRYKVALDVEGEDDGEILRVYHETEIEMLP